MKKCRKKLNKNLVFAIQINIRYCSLQIFFIFFKKKTTDGHSWNLYQAFNVHDFPTF